LVDIRLFKKTLLMRRFKNQECRLRSRTQLAHPRSSEMGFPIKKLSINHLLAIMTR